MEKIKNGDAVLYKNLQGIVYGKPRENKYKGLLYTVKVGNEYYKASASELTSLENGQPGTQSHTFEIFDPTERR